MGRQKKDLLRKLKETKCMRTLILDDSKELTFLDDNLRVSL